MEPCVSIVIICMNNLKNLYPCLCSIQKFTSIKYEVIVVAYLFSSENLRKVRNDFPWVKIIESNEIRGFSENNNLALKVARGKYCFVLNDDTEMKMDVVGLLFRDMEKLSENIAIVCPVTLNKNGSVQRCGKPKYNFGTLLLSHLNCLKKYEQSSKYVNGTGLFQTYNISGAAFFIRTQIFKKLGWFDERYFFCPEDIALSTKANKLGYKVFVDADAQLTHFGGGTWSKTIIATKPAAVKGGMYFYAGENKVLKLLYVMVELLVHFNRLLYWVLFGFFKDKDHRFTMITANKNALAALLSRKTPKELFTKYFQK